MKGLRLIMALLDNRFKRIGPNAMRGRGIGAARGRATIQRGKSSTPCLPSLSHSSIRGRIRELTHGVCFVFLFFSKRPTWNDKDKPRCQALRPLAFFGLLGFGLVGWMDGCSAGFLFGGCQEWIMRMVGWGCARRGLEAGQFTRRLGSGLRR